MSPRYVVDTNVLIAASSASDPAFKIDATPNDPVLREKIWQWLSDFAESDSHLVLDGQGGIENEYKNKLEFNDYGRGVVMYKWDTCAVDLVSVDYDAEGHGILDEPLQNVVHDLADRKMVAAALAALTEHGEAAIAFAGDTDWHGWEDDLRKAGLDLEPIIPEWSRNKFDEKNNK